MIGPQRTGEMPAPQNNYYLANTQALKLVTEKLKTRNDLSEQCRRSGSVFDPAGPAIYTRFLNRICKISLPDIDISFTDPPGALDQKEKILVFHYLDRAGGSVPGQEQISYQELEEGAAYYPSFLQRCVKPLIETFGQFPEKLFPAAAQFGCQKASFGDAAVVIPAFPKVCLTYIVWKGDEEFPANAGILFDRTVQDYLPAEDINVLCQLISWKLIKSVK